MDQSNFFSINNLVEFGMGMAIAQQMVQTMNHTIGNMNVPGSMPTQEQGSLFYAKISEELLQDYKNAKQYYEKIILDHKGSIFKKYQTINWAYS